jgi:hypothetical protein
LPTRGVVYQAARGETEINHDLNIFFCINLLINAQMLKIEARRNTDYVQKRFSKFNIHENMTLKLSCEKFSKM